MKKVTDTEYLLGALKHAIDETRGGRMDTKRAKSVAALVMSATRVRQQRLAEIQHGGLKLPEKMEADSYYDEDVAAAVAAAK